MKQLRTYATLLSLMGLIGLPMWSVGCGGPAAYDGNGDAESGPAAAPEAGSTVDGGTEVPGIPGGEDEGTPDAATDQ